MLINSSVSGCLYCFHVLATVNNAAMNMVYRYLFEILLSVILDRSPDGLLDHMVTVTFNFLKEQPTLSSIVAVLFYVSTNNAQGFLFLHLLANTGYFLFLS